MADQPSSFQFEDVPLDEARRMSRGPRMDPELYQHLRTRIQSLSDQAVRKAAPAVADRGAPAKRSHTTTRSAA